MVFKIQQKKYTYVVSILLIVGSFYFAFKEGVFKPQLLALPIAITFLILFQRWRQVVMIKDGKLYLDRFHFIEKNDSYELKEDDQNRGIWLITKKYKKPLLLNCLLEKRDVFIENIPLSEEFIPIKEYVKNFRNED